MKEAGQSSLMAWASKAKKRQETDNPSVNVTEPMPSISTTESKSAQDEVILVPDMN